MTRQQGPTQGFAVHLPGTREEPFSGDRMYDREMDTLPFKWTRDLFRGVPCR